MSCRVKNLKPPCGYSLDGIAKIWLLDHDDFSGYRFDKNDMYSNCLVTDILRIGDYIELEAPDMVAKYAGTGNYSHSLDSFISTISHETISNLHLATKRRHIVVFLANNGRYYTFGYEAGAVLSYQNQTAEGFGHLVNLNAPSRYPIFEVTADAMGRFIAAHIFKVDFDNNAYCEIL